MLHTKMLSCVLIFPKVPPDPLPLSPPTPPFPSSAFCLLVAPCQAIESKLSIAWQGATSKQKALDGNGGVQDSKFFRNFIPHPLYVFRRGQNLNSTWSPHSTHRANIWLWTERITGCYTDSQKLLLSQLNALLDRDVGNYQSRKAKDLNQWNGLSKKINK